MKITRPSVGAAVATATLTMLSTAPATAAASLGVGDPILMQSMRTLDVSVQATCDDVGQDSTFIVVNVSQGSYPATNYVEGAGDVLDVTCDGSPHFYRVKVRLTFGKASWRVGAASVDGILSNCYQDSCTTQAFFGPQAATIKRH